MRIAKLAPEDLDLSVLQRFDRAGPGYTSYPTVDRFVEAFGAEAYRTWAKKRNVGAVLRPLSLSLHIPFSRSLCIYCSCRDVITRDEDRADRYLRALKTELELQGELFCDDFNVVQLHWGGGIPSFFSAAQMQELMATIRTHFRLLPGAECSIEVDPRSTREESVALLAELGFKRMSLRVQGFDPVNRVQPAEETAAVISAARTHVINSISIDLAYGLPHQSIENFGRALDELVAIAPDQLLLHSVVRLPDAFEPQRRISKSDLSDAQSRLQLLRVAIERLDASGYQCVGADEFAKTEGAPAAAQAQGWLRRSLLACSSRSDRVPIGVTAIGNIGPSYSQNAHSLDEYYDHIERDELPITRGIDLSADDLARRAVIQALMCDFEVSKETIEIAYLIEFDRYFALELDELKAFEADGLLTLEERWITLSFKGQLAVRSICMVFDKYLRADRKRTRYPGIM